MNLPAQYFRAGVGAIIINDKGLILALERTDVPGAWQLPQGGLEAHEEPLQAVLREVAEETGIAATHLQLLESYPEPLVYELPSDLQCEKTGRGQVQYWFLFRHQASNREIDLKNSSEFQNWKWQSFGILLNSVADFRKPVYRKLYHHFRNYIFLEA